MLVGVVAPMSRERRDAVVTWTVWAVWLAMAAATFAFTAHFAVDLPQWDEAQYVPVLAGERAYSVAWLLERHVDHLVAISRTLYVAAVGAARDFRAAPFLTDAIDAGAVALLLVTARKLRGRTVLADAFFPLASLHWGRLGDMLWGDQLQYVSTGALQAIALCVMLRCRESMSRGAAIGLGACLVAMAFAGGQGVVMVPALALWLALAARGQGGATRIAGALAAAVALVAALAIGLSGTPAHETTRDPSRIGATVLQFAGMAAGPAGRFGWDGTRLGEAFPPLVSIGVALGVTATVVLLITAMRRRASDRLAAGALLAHLAATVSLAIVIGVGRSALTEHAGLQDRYGPAALPLAWTAYFAWDLFAGRARRAALGLVVAAAVLLVPLHAYVGLLHAGERKGRMEAAARALRSGEAHDAVAARFVPLLHHDPKALARVFDTLERARLGPFRR